MHLVSCGEASQCLESLFGETCLVWRVTLSLCVALCASVRVPIVLVRVVCGRLLIRAFELTGLCFGPTRCTECVVQRLSLQVQEMRAEEERRGEIED